jgi:hypothetical protein
MIKGVCRIGAWLFGVSVFVKGGGLVKRIGNAFKSEERLRRERQEQERKAIIGLHVGVFVWGGIILGVIAYLSH